MRLRIITVAMLAATLAVAAGPAAPSASAQARLNYRVTIYNLTYDQVFSPPVLATHTSQTRIFRSGGTASANLRMLAEDGATDPLRNELGVNSQVLTIVAASAPIPPGQSASFEVTAMGSFDRLSAVGMLVTTNDAFFGLDSFDIDFDAVASKSPVALLVPAYDAGTESNNEMCAFIPGPPCGNGGVRDTSGAEGSIHIHRGIHGGADLDPSQFDWRNPVAKIVITKLP